MRAESSSEELRTIGFGKIEVDIPRRGLMARGHHSEPLQRIGFIASARLIEIAGGIGELRVEFGDELRADLVATGADGRAESGKEIGGFAAKFKAQAAHGLFGDTSERALPTRMNGGDGALFGIDEKDWNAIGGLHGEKQAGPIRDGGVAFARVARRAGEKVNHVGVNLLEQCEREVFGGERGLQEAAVFSDIFARIPFHEAEIENLPAIELADAAGPRAESVDEPREFTEWRELQDLQAVRMMHYPGRRKTQPARSSAFAD